MKSTDNKYNLYKSIFKFLPKKKFICFIIIIIIIVFFDKKFLNNFLSKVIYPLKIILPCKIKNSNSTTDRSIIDYSSSKKLSYSLLKEKEIDINNNYAIRKIKIKKSISGTKKKLEEKKSKSLVHPGTYKELEKPKGIYHLVVFIHLDKIYVMRKVQDLIKINFGVYLILPRIDKGEKYYRVTIGHSNTLYEANEKIKKLKSKFKHIFIFKY